jgi:hypothetical protein
MVSERGESRSVVVPEGGLLQLVEVEARLAQALAAAEEEGRALVRAARDEAAAQAARLQAGIDLETAALADRIAAERDAESGRVLVAAEARCRRLRELSDEEVDRMAAAVEARLLDAGAGR